MFTRQGSSWRCKTPWKGLGINPAGEMRGIPTILPWAPSVVSDLPLQPCLTSLGHPERMEFTQDPSWESLMDVLPNPTDTGPFAADSRWSVGFEGCGFGIHWLPPKATKFMPQGILFSFSSRFPALFWDFFFLPAHFIPFPRPLVPQERFWRGLIRNLTLPPVTFASPATGAMPGC